MHVKRVNFIAAVASVVSLGLGSMASEAHASAQSGEPSKVSGLHGFDFEFGDWRVHHRAKKATGDHSWVEFDGTAKVRPLMDGAANIEDNVFLKQSGVTRGVALRAFDLKTEQWAIWWVDGRDPHGALDPPVKGNFVDGVGTFYSDGIVDGKPTRTRFIWSRITATSARWEQAFSADGGSTWDTNWIMDFQRAP